MSWAEALVGFPVFEKDFFREEPDGIACGQGHRKPEGVEGKFCSVCGTKFREATKTVPTETHRRWFERPEFVGDIPRNWDEFGEDFESGEKGRIIYREGSDNLYFWGETVGSGSESRTPSSQGTRFEAIEKARAKVQADLDVLGLTDRAVNLHVFHHYS
jgi:hypothetical protein